MVDYFKHALDYNRERVRRAEEHFAELAREVASMMEKQAQSVPFDIDPKPPHGAINVGLPPETFAGMRLGTLVGEIVYNLRCALDYLVYALAILDSGSPQEGTQFPIVDAQKDWPSNVGRLLKGVSTAHIAAIEGLQPYNGCNWTGRLRDLSNMDKHRQIVPGGGRIGATVHTEFVTDLSRVVGGIDRHAIHPITGEKVKVKVHVGGEILFKDGSPVVQTLHELQAGVADTLAAFETDFPL